MLVLILIFKKFKEELGNGAKSWVTRDEHMECKRYINFSPIRTPFVFSYIFSFMQSLHVCIIVIKVLSLHPPLLI
jgi:hypothetical protein